MPHDLRSIRRDTAAYLRHFEAHDQLGNLLGARITALSAEECRSEYDVSPAHFNPNGILHGGTLFSVMDSSQGAFVHLILDPQYRYAATGTATIRYEAPVTGGRVRMRTWLDRTEGRKLFVQSEAQDESGKVVARLEETWIAVV